ncbi:hypothetical protein AX16_000214 [Volvariella volvacea WC 439]|nr:hypothetical protein AX16_000214 [Volvariella volvacea WC 439]
MPPGHRKQGRVCIVLNTPSSLTATSASKSLRFSVTKQLDIQMNGNIQLAVQLSSLFPSPATSIPIPTTQQKTLSSPQPQSDLLLEHASFSSVLHTQETGTILLRVLHGGLIVELVSLSTDITPVRFVFPTKILPSPAIVLLESSELHIIAVTDNGSLYRLVIPVGVGLNLWQSQLYSLMPREYHIKSVQDVQNCLVHVQGPHCVALALPNGTLLRLEAEYVGSEDDGDQWTEYLFQHGSLFSSLASFLPLSSNLPGASDIISMATHPWPTDLSHIWTLSRDRTVKLWKAKIGCVASKTLSWSPGRDLTPSGIAPSGKSHSLLPPEFQTLLRVSSGQSDDHLIVVAFLPSTSASTSGGAFHLLNTVSDQFYEIGVVECSKISAHCHLQDFMLIGNSLFALWDRQGQSVVEKAVINQGALSDGELEWTPWQSASHAPEPELTPAHLEEQLLSPGSMTNNFFEAIMRPGVFSPLTLRTAIDQYMDACLSLPGPHPPQLTTSYATLGENIAAVVGCTVTLNRDPQTGALQYANYWNALKRDWEGFIARCREVERSARWPLVLGSNQEQGSIIVVERERVGLLVAEDLPLQIQRCLAVDHSIDQQYELFSILSPMRSKLGPQALRDMENRLLDILHQETAFYYADILRDQAQRSKFQDYIDEGTATSTIGRLQGLEDLDLAIRTALDVIGGLGTEVKHEEDEVPLLPPAHNLELSRSLTSSYIMTTINARYNLCLSLFTLLFFLAEELQSWDPSLLAEVFAVSRGVVMLRYIARHPAGPIEPAAAQSSPDDVVLRLRNMDVSRNRGHFTPTYSIVHHLLSDTGDIYALPESAHRFIDSTGLLQSISPAHVTGFEVTICEKLRQLAFYDAAHVLLSWLPRTPAVTYVQGRLLLNAGRPDDAAQLFQKLAGCFGTDSGLSSEDAHALASVLPQTESFDSEFAFCLHASGLFRQAGIVCYDVSFAKAALLVAPAIDTSPLWNGVIRGYIELAEYSNAYATLMTSPHEKQKRETISQLVYRMCEDNEVEALMSFNFAGIADEVEDALAFKARNVDPRLKPHYSKVLYTWYIQRGDYRSAALTMYQRGRKFAELLFESFSLALAEEQLESYLIAINALSLLDSSNAWILVPVPLDIKIEPQKRRKLSHHIPEDKYSLGIHGVEVVQLSDIQQEYALLSAQIDLIRRDPSVQGLPDLLVPPPLIVLKLGQANRFNQAMMTARSLDVDMSDLFSDLAVQCMRLTRDPDAVIQEDNSDWLLTDQVSSWAGSPADRGWRYLRQSLEKHDNIETDYKYTKATLDTILSIDRLAPPPPWLLQTLQADLDSVLILTGALAGTSPRVSNTNVPSL